MFSSLILGLMAAFGWGTADFLARFAARRIGAYRTLFFIQSFGLLILTPWMALQGRGFSVGSGHHAVLWAILAGLLNVVSGLALYHSFKVGALAVVAPISGSYPALTLLFAVWSGEVITRMRAAGIALILVGVPLVAISFAGRTPESHRTVAEGEAKLARGVGWAVLAAAGFGTVFWLLGFHVMPTLGGVASVWIIRLTTFVTLAAIAAPLRQSLRLPQGKTWWTVAGVGVLDTAAFVTNNTGLKSGEVSLVTVLASLYSSVTVLLAWAFLRERMAWSQWLGVGLIFAGIVLMSR